MLIKTCSPFRFDFASTEYPQRLVPHCSIRTLPSFSSVSQTPSGELASRTAAAEGAGPCGRCGTGPGAGAGGGTAARVDDGSGLGSSGLGSSGLGSSGLGASGLGARAESFRSGGAEAGGGGETALSAGALFAVAVDGSGDVVAAGGGAGVAGAAAVSAGAGEVCGSLFASCGDCL